MPTVSVQNITGGNPQNPGTGNTATGESSVAFDTSSKEFKLFDGTTLYRLPTDNAFSGTVPPISGTAGTGAATFAQPGAIYRDVTNKVEYFNEGTLASPYWTPSSFNQPGLVGVNTDFSTSAGLAGTSTAASFQDAGVRYFGLSLPENDANTDITVSWPVNGPILTVGTDNQTDITQALGFGSTTALWAPATNGTMVIDVTFTAVTDILTRYFFCGFSGESIDALVALVKSATTTITFSPGGTTGDDVHGLIMDSRLTAASDFFLATVKANAVATLTTAQAALTVTAQMPAAATYVRLRLEIATDGTLYAFVNKVLVKTVATGATAATKLAPCFSQSNTTTTASLRMALRRFGCWATRG